MTGDDLEEMGIPEGPAVTMVRNCIAKDWPAESRMLQAQLEAEAEVSKWGLASPVPPVMAMPLAAGARSLSFAERDNPPAAQKPALSDAQEADLASFCKLTAHVTGAAAAREAMHLAGWDLTTALNVRAAGALHGHPGAGTHHHPATRRRRWVRRRGAQD